MKYTNFIFHGLNNDMQNSRLVGVNSFHSLNNFSNKLLNKFPINSNLMKVTNKLKKFINFHKFIEINCTGLGVGSDIGQ